MNDDEKNAGNEPKARATGATTTSVYRVKYVSITGGERVAEIRAEVVGRDQERYCVCSKDKKLIDALYNAWKDWSYVLIVAREGYDLPSRGRVLYDVEKIERFEEALQ